MGTINYHTSDFITMAIQPYNTDDYIKDNDFMDFIRDEWHVDINNESEVLNAVYEQINENYSCDYDNAAVILSRYDFDLFDVSIQPGYYEGYSIKIELSVWRFDDYSEKLAAQKEVTQIKKFLQEIAGCGFVMCYPGWITSYFDYTATMQGITEATKAMRQAVKDTPTYYQACIMAKGGIVA